MTEQWRDVVGYEDLFQVSSHGRVMNKRTGNVLKQALTPNGYYCIATKVGGRSGMKVNFKVHRLVADAFLDQPDSALVELCKAKGFGKVLVRHLDDDKTNNFYKNLAWGSHKDNYEDFRRTPRYAGYVKKISATMARIKAR